MNPLDRERRRRRRIAGRLCLLMGPLLVATAGVVGPSIGRHRTAVAEHEDSLARFDEQVRAIADLIEFKRSYVTGLSAAESRLAATIDDAPLPIDFRARLRALLESHGIEVRQVDRIGNADPDGGEPEGEPFAEDGDGTVETIALPFACDRALVEATLRFADLPVALSTLEASDPCAVVERVDLRRDPDRFGFVALRCELAFPVRRPNPEGP